MNKKVLVTGGAGFIASHVVDAYIASGFTVAVLDNLSSGSKVNINPQALFYNVDVTNKESVHSVVKEFKPQLINHHAAHLLVGDSVHHPQFNAEVNILGLLNLMESAKDYGLEKVIMASTGGAMYGNQALPFIETMKEDPLSPYGVSKRAAEMYLRYYLQQYQIPFTVLRYSNVYGPRQDSSSESGVIAIFCNMMAKNMQPTINGDGSQTRDFVYVSDVVAANMAATEREYCGALNIGTNTEITVNQLFDLLKSEFTVSFKQKHGPGRPGEQKESRLDYTLAHTVLGWEPQVNLLNGLRTTIAWYKRSQ